MEIVISMKGGQVPPLHLEGKWINEAWTLPQGISFSYDILMHCLMKFYFFNSKTGYVVKATTDEEKVQFREQVFSH
jgi:hypothetical protein